MTLLAGIYQYLIDRDIDAKLYFEYIQIEREYTIVQIKFNNRDEDAGVVCVEISRMSKKHRKLCKSIYAIQRLFDIYDDSSLQKIYEFVTSRQHKKIDSKKANSWEGNL